MANCSQALTCAREMRALDMGCERSLVRRITTLLDGSASESACPTFQRILRVSRPCHLRYCMHVRLAYSTSKRLPEDHQKRQDGHSSG